MKKIVVGLVHHVPVIGGHIDCNGCSFYTVGDDCQHPFNVNVGGIIGCYASAGIFKAVPIETTPEQAVPVRSTDPSTSKAWKDLSKYERVVFEQLTRHGDLTGKEIAANSKVPLNCITPRFAPMRRAGLIEASGLRRDKQIVWALS